METKIMEYILSIAGHKSISRAADELYLTQSALNQQLLKLEKELGAPLFIRTRNHWELTITIDCDVLQGDGGTRTASVTGGFVALALACRRLVENGDLGASPIRHYVTGVSAGIVDDTALLDLRYSEDSRAQVDLNCVMNELGELIEIQGTGEGRAFSSAIQARRAGSGRRTDLGARVKSRSLRSRATPAWRRSSGVISR